MRYRFGEKICKTMQGIADIEDITVEQLRQKMNNPPYSEYRRIWDSLDEDGVASHSVLVLFLSSLVANIPVCHLSSINLQQVSRAYDGSQHDAGQGGGSGTSPTYNYLLRGGP